MVSATGAAELENNMNTLDILHQMMSDDESDEIKLRKFTVAVAKLMGANSDAIALGQQIADGTVDLDDDRVDDLRADLDSSDKFSRFCISRFPLDAAMGARELATKNGIDAGVLLATYKAI